MALGPLLGSSDPFSTLYAQDLQYRGPDAYQQLLPYALDDVCIEYSRATQTDKVFGFDAIDNMLVNLLYTRIGERDFEPLFGSNTIDLLFEPNDELPQSPNFTLIEIEIFDRVRRWVPYIDIVLSGIIVQSLPVPQAFAISFVYSHAVTGIPHTFTAFLTYRGTFQ